MAEQAVGAQPARYCIIRTAGAATLTVANALVAAGIAAWTPRAVIKRRRPRSKATVEREAPILPTFVFVPADYLPDLYRMLAAPVKPQPSFSIFRHAGRIPLVSAGQMVSLRVEEEQAADALLRERERARAVALRAATNVPPIGTRVRVPQVAFTGMTGVVEGGKGRAAVVNFGGGRTITVDAWLLETDQVHRAAA